MEIIRRQLTLFVPAQFAKKIEEVRARYNPIQHDLIAAHVTLCREDEIMKIDKAIKNIQSLFLKEPITIEFDKPQRFGDDKGVLIPSKSSCQLEALRKMVLEEIIDTPRKHHAHITLMHPRNSICNNDLFQQITSFRFPKSIIFNTISLIEQRGKDRWKVLANFPITD